MAVVIETTVGDFTVDLFIDSRPQACKNFLKLCKIKYYNFCLFHSVQSNFLAQTGDPTGTGSGGESIYGLLYGENARYFEAETMPKLKHNKPGLLSMVNCGNNMLGSQFFITLGEEVVSLDGEHCVFGEISEGVEIVLKLNEAICDTQHRPYKDIRARDKKRTAAVCHSQQRTTSVCSSSPLTSQHRYLKPNCHVCPWFSPRRLVKTNIRPQPNFPLVTVRCD